MPDKSPDYGLSDERIRIRAYEVFLRRGGQGGSPESDWLLAREELSQETAASAPPPATTQPTQPTTKPRAAKAAVETASQPAASARDTSAPPKRSVRNVRPNTASRRSR
jgi:Protein of unknown function (DUF2934)